ncbi:hypothetical protein ABIC08_001835 [Bradyrhizobium sp. RT9b]
MNPYGVKGSTGIWQNLRIHKMEDPKLSLLESYRSGGLLYGVVGPRQDDDLGGLAELLSRLQIYAKLKDDGRSSGLRSRNAHRSY